MIFQIEDFLKTLTGLGRKQYASYFGQSQIIPIVMNNIFVYVVHVRNLVIHGRNA